MGMYTDFQFDFKVKRDSELQKVLSRKSTKTHSFFDLARSNVILPDYQDHTDNQNVYLVGEVKNYQNEIESFIELLSKYANDIESNGELGWYRYKSDPSATKVFLHNNSVITVEPIYILPS